MRPLQARGQQERILAHLARGRKLTALQALRIAGTMKLSTRVGELRKRNHDIQSRWIERGGKRFKQYFLTKH